VRAYRRPPTHYSVVSRAACHRRRRRLSTRPIGMQCIAGGSTVTHARNLPPSFRYQ